MEWLKLSFPISIHRCHAKKKLSCSDQWIHKRPPLFNPITFPFSLRRTFLWEREQVPGAACATTLSQLCLGWSCPSNASSPTEGTPPLAEFSVALLAPWFRFVSFSLYSVWLAFDFYSSLPCMPSVSVASVAWSCFPRPGSRRRPPSASIAVRSHLLLVFLPSGTSCSNLEALLPFFVQRRRDILWRPALCTHLPLGPFPEVPSLGLPLTWRNPINTVTGNALLWAPLSSQSRWWSCWRIS